MYFYDSQTIWASDGELHIEGTNGTVTFNMDNLIDDIPYIVNRCIAHHDSRKKNLISEINKEINPLTSTQPSDNLKTNKQW